MSRVFFIQASLAVKNRLGRAQLFMEKDTSGSPLLKFLIEQMRLVNSIDKVCVVTSDKEVDAEVVSLVNDLAKDTDTSLKPLFVYRIASDKPYAFSDDNVLAEKLINNVPIYGLYSANGIVDICQDLVCDQGVFLAAETDIAMTADYINRTIDKYGEEDAAIKALYFFSAKSFQNALRQYLIKRNKDNNVALANIAGDIEELRQTHLYSDEQITHITKTKKTNFSVFYESDLVNINVLLGYMHDKQRKKVLDFRGVKPPMFLWNSIHLDQIKQTIDFLKDITPAKIFKYVADHQTSNVQKSYPGFLDIEITSKCNMSCQYCPQTMLTRPKQDMSLDVFKKIVDDTVNYIPFLSLSGYGEPLLNPDIIEAVKYAKEKGFFRVLLETNAALLDDNMLQKLSEAGLDIISLNLNALDQDSDYARENLPSEAVIKRILDFNNKNKAESFLLVLQVIKTQNNNDLIEFYYQRFEYVADKIVIKAFNDFLGEFDNDSAVDFSPLSKDRKNCAKTMHSLVVASNGQPLLCQQDFNKTQSFEESMLDNWEQNRTVGGSFDFCADCKEWHLIDAFSSIFTYGAYINYSYIYIGQEIVRCLSEMNLDSDSKTYEKEFKEFDKFLKVYPYYQDIYSSMEKALKKL